MILIDASPRRSASGTLLLHCGVQTPPKHKSATCSATWATPLCFDSVPRLNACRCYRNFFAHGCTFCDVPGLGVDESGSTGCEDLQLDLR